MMDSTWARSEDGGDEDGLGSKGNFRMNSVRYTFLDASAHVSVYTLFVFSPASFLSNRSRRVLVFIVQSSLTISDVQAARATKRAFHLPVQCLWVN